MGTVARPRSVVDAPPFVETCHSILLCHNSTYDDICANCVNAKSLPRILTRPPNMCKFFGEKGVFIKQVNTVFTEQFKGATHLMKERWSYIKGAISKLVCILVE